MSKNKIHSLESVDSLTEEWILKRLDWIEQYLDINWQLYTGTRENYILSMLPVILPEREEGIRKLAKNTILKIRFDDLVILASINMD